MTSPQQNQFGTAGEPSVNNQASGGAGTSPQISNPAPAPVPTAPVLGPSGAGGTYTVDQILAGSDQELNQANQDVARIWDQIRPVQQQITTLQASTNPLDQQKLTAATSNLNSLYSTLSQAMQRVETANASRASTLQKAIDSNQLVPSQVDLAQAQSAKAKQDGALARAQADVLTQGSAGQRDLVAAQAGLAAAQAAGQSASAAAITAKTPDEQAQLRAQAAALNAQAAQTTQLLPGLIAKQTAETGLTQAQTGLTGSQSQLAQAQATQAAANAGLANAQAAQTTATTGQLLPAQAGLAGAQATNQLASAAGQLATIEQNKLGPAFYGFQDRVNAIRAIQAQEFGPGGGGDPAHANELLQQYIDATISGTTPYEANVSAANAGLTAFGTQASLANAAQAAAASRANAYATTAGSVLSTLAQMNANAPKGSTLLEGAFNDVMSRIAGGTQAPQFAAPAMPQAPQLPALLQRLAPLGAAPMPGAPPPAGQVPGIVPPPTAPAAPVAPVPNSATVPNTPQTSAPVTINIGGQGQGQAPAPTTATPDWYGAWQQRQAADTAQQRVAASMFQAPQYPGLAQGQNVPASPSPNQATTGTGLPNMLQQYQPAGLDFVHQLWGGELGAGAVRSPYAAMGAT